MKDFTKYMSAHKSYYSAVLNIISGYYLKNVRQIIQESTNNLSVFHFESTLLLAEKNGISYYKVKEISGKRTAVINSDGEITVPFNNYKYLFIYEDDLLEYSLNGEKFITDLDGKVIERYKEQEQESLLQDSNNPYADEIAQGIIKGIKNVKNPNLCAGLVKQKEEFWFNNQEVVRKNTKLLEKSPYACKITNNRYNKTVFITNERNKRFFIVKDKTSQKCGLINAKGELMSDFIWDDIFGFTHSECDFIAVRNGSKFGLIDCCGNIVADVVYDDVICFSDGFGAVKQNNKSGYINTSGEIVIPIIYDKAGMFLFGKAEVALNGETFYINRKGERLEEWGKKIWKEKIKRIKTTKIGLMI